MIDIESIKPGDKVTVEATVTAVRPGVGVERPDIFVSINHEYGRIGPAAIVSHTPAPREIKVGDRVERALTRDYFASCGEVLAIVGDKAWISIGFGDSIVLLADLRHAPPPR